MNLSFVLLYMSFVDSLCSYIHIFTSKSPYKSLNCLFIIQSSEHCSVPWLCYIEKERTKLVHYQIKWSCILMGSAVVVQISVVGQYFYWPRCRGCTVPEILFIFVKFISSLLILRLMSPLRFSSLFSR